MKSFYGPLLAIATVIGAPAAHAQYAITSSSGRHIDLRQDPSDALIVAPNGTAAPLLHLPTAPGLEHDLPANCVVAMDEPCQPLPLADFMPQWTPVSIIDEGISRELASWDLASVRADKGSQPELSLSAALAQDTENESAVLSDAENQPCGLACKPAGAGIAPHWADHVPAEYATHPGFWKQLGTIKTESLLFVGYFTAISSHKFFKETKPFHFKDEGWFGKNTDNVGVDKLAHAFNTYLLAEFLHSRLHRRTGASEGDALTAAIVASGLMLFNETSDAFEPDSGWSIQDVLMNLGGAGFSILRNTVPGLKEKLAFKIEVVPNDSFYSRAGKKHYAQQRFMLSLKGTGFKELDNSPLRYLDLQLGYYASDFLLKDRAAGIEPKRHIFVGVGLNLGELLFGKSTSGFGKAGFTVLDYFQVPYTSLRYDTTGRFGGS